MLGWGSAVMLSCCKLIGCYEEPSPPANHSSPRACPGPQHRTGLPSVPSMSESPDTAKTVTQQLGWSSTRSRVTRRIAAARCGCDSAWTGILCFIWSEHPRDFCCTHALAHLRNDDTPPSCGRRWARSARPCLAGEPLPVGEQGSAAPASPRCRGLRRLASCLAPAHFLQH